ncbi:MAG: hypothetical protein EBS09_05500 [Flavobacteriia bacterium]|nr:hypothetical protein [Flavobacteriia bacterium]
MKKLNFMILGISIGFLFACDKNNTAEINIMEPMMNDTIALNDSLHLEADILGSDKLFGYSVSLTHTNTQTQLFSASTEKRRKDYVFHSHWLNNVQDTANLEIKITVNLSRSGKTVTKTMQCVALPN